MNTIKESQLHILVQLALADENFTESERKAIRETGQRYQLDEASVDAIMSNPDLVRVLPALDQEQAMDFIIDSMFILLADKEIHDSEDAFIRKMAIQLGFEEQVITFLMDYHTMDRQPLKNMMKKYLRK